MMDAFFVKILHLARELFFLVNPHHAKDGMCSEFYNVCTSDRVCFKWIFTLFPVRRPHLHVAGDRESQIGDMHRIVCYPMMYCLCVCKRRLIGCVSV